MKLHKLFALLIIVCFVSSATIGEITTAPSGEGYGTNSSASASASKGNPVDYDYEFNEWWEQTDTAGDFDWEIIASAYAWCSCFVDGGSVRAIAESEGVAVSPYGLVNESASVDISSTATQADGVHSDSDSGSDDHFDAYEAVASQCDSWAYASVEEGSDSSADAYCRSTGYCSLSE